MGRPTVCRQCTTVRLNEKAEAVAGPTIKAPRKTASKVLDRRCLQATLSATVVMAPPR